MRLAVLILAVISCSTAAPLSKSPVDLLVSYRVGERAHDQRLFGSFSPIGQPYETQGDVVQVSPYRACDVKRKGYDRTQVEHVAVVFFDELEPFVAGCVSLESQIRFAQKSGAIALVVGPASRVVLQKEKNFIGTIPVVMLDEIETNRLKRQLESASQAGSVVHIGLQAVHFRPAPAVLRLQVFRPTVLNIGLIILLLLLIVFISGLVIIKIRWRPQSSRDAWLRTLARSALSKMEVRKFEKMNAAGNTTGGGVGERRRFLMIRSTTKKARYLPVFGSLTSVAHSSSNQERCSICLEEYKQGEELRVLFCGHEFHPKCVDPWLISNRRCPLCLYDVVYKEYPTPDTPCKTPHRPSQSQDRAVEDEAIQTDPMFYEFDSRLFSYEDQQLLPSTSSHSVGRPRPPRARSAGSRRRRSRRHPVTISRTPIGTISGYSSDVSSSSFVDDRPSRHRRRLLVDREPNVISFETTSSK